MHAKPGIPAPTLLPSPSTSLSVPETVADSPLSAAFSKALGSPSAKSHIVEAAERKQKKSVLEAKTMGPRGFDRVVPVKPIAPRSGHR